MHLHPALLLRFGQGDRRRLPLAPWPTKPAILPHRSTNRRFRSLPGSRRPLRTAGTMLPRLSKIFTLVGKLANSDEGEDEESDDLLSI